MKAWSRVKKMLISTIHCKCFDNKNYGDWKLRGKSHDNYRPYNYQWGCPQFLQPSSKDSADFPSRDPKISSPRSFYGQKFAVYIWICTWFHWVSKNLEGLSTIYVSAASMAYLVNRIMRGIGLDRLIGFGIPYVPKGTPVWIKCYTLLNQI